jgi:hypothetical protein
MVGTATDPTKSMASWINNNVKKDDVWVSAESRTVGKVGKGATAFQMAQSLVLDSDKAKKTLGSKVDVGSLRTRDLGLLAALLLAERAAGPKSAYADYIASLPAQPPGVLSWPVRTHTHCLSLYLRIPPSSNLFSADP